MQHSNSGQLRYVNTTQISTLKPYRACLPAQLHSRQSSCSYKYCGLQQHSLTRQRLPVRVNALRTEEKKARKGTLQEVFPLISGSMAFNKLRAKARNFKILGLDPSPELLAISAVYAIQGILGLSRLAVAFFLKDKLELGPAEVAFMQGTAAFPWMIKPLYGFISDSIPLFGYHRRSYLILAGLTGACAWISFSTVVSSPQTALAAMLGASLSNAAADVLVDSLVVERARDAPQAVAGSLQSLCWGSQAVGGIVSAYFSGYLVETFGSRFVFGITALFPLIVSCSAMLIDEEQVGSKSKSRTSKADNSASSRYTDVEVTVISPDASVRAPLLGDGNQQSTAVASSTSIAKDLVKRSGNAMSRSSSATRNIASPGSVASNGADVAPAGFDQDDEAGRTLWQNFLTRGGMLWSAVTRKDILLPTLLVFCWQATPSADTAMFFFQTNELGFKPEFMGRVRLVSSVASLLGVTLYNTSLKKVPLRKLLWWTMLLGAALGSTQLLLVSRVNVSLGIPDQMFVLGDTALLTALGQCSFMPILVLAARLCPKGVEATLFATLMSILNAGGALSSGIGAAATKFLGVTSDNFDNLFTLVLICNISQLLPAPLLYLIPDALNRPDLDDDEDAAGNSKKDDSILPISDRSSGSVVNGNGNGHGGSQHRHGRAHDSERDSNVEHMAEHVINVDMFGTKTWEVPGGYEEGVINKKHQDGLK